MLPHGETVLLPRAAGTHERWRLTYGRWRLVRDQLRGFWTDLPCNLADWLTVQNGSKSFRVPRQDFG